MYSARSQGRSRKENPIKEGTQFEIWNIEHRRMHCETITEII